MLKEIWDSKKKEVVMAIAVLASILTIFTGIAFVEDRYVHAADFSAYAENQQKALKDFRVQNLEDKIFELDFKEQSGQATALDRALKERFKNQLDSIHGR